MTDFSKMNHVRLDALREIGNIGAGHAAASLSSITQQKVMIDVCRADLTNIKDMDRMLHQESGDLLDIQSDFSGPIKGCIHYVMSKAGAVDFMDMLSVSPNGIAKESVGNDLTVLKKCGSILLSAYLKAIGDLAQFSLVCASADAGYVKGMNFGSEILSKQNTSNEMVFGIETAFIASGKRIKVYFLLRTDQRGLELMFQQLGIV